MRSQPATPSAATAPNDAVTQSGHRLSAKKFAYSTEMVGAMAVGMAVLHPVWLFVLDAAGLMHNPHTGVPITATNLDCAATAGSPRQGAEEPAHGKLSRTSAGAPARSETGMATAVRTNRRSTRNRPGNAVTWVPPIIGPATSSRAVTVPAASPTMSTLAKSSHRPVSGSRELAWTATAQLQSR